MRKTKITALLLCCSLLLSGCESEEEKAINEKNLRQAEENAVEYIEKKYGFTPTVTESILEQSPGLFGGTYLTSAMVRLTYDDKEFSVYIDGETKNTDGADNYQEDDIISAVTDRISSVTPQLRSLRLRGGEGLGVYPNFYGYDRDYFNNLYSAYFDGNNFDEVFSDTLCSITVDYIDADFTELNEKDFDFLTFGSQFGMDMLSYRTEADYENKPDYGEISDFASIKKHAILIEESLSFGKNGREHGEYTLGQCDNFYYYISDNEPETVSFSEVTMPDISNWSGNGVIDGEFVTPAYKIDNSANERLYIYYPLSELPEKARIATYVKTDEGEKFRVSPLTEDMGNYKMVYIQSKTFSDAYFDDNSEICFAFITEKEKSSNEQ